MVNKLQTLQIRALRQLIISLLIFPPRDHQYAYIEKAPEGTQTTWCPNTVCDFSE